MDKKIKIGTAKKADVTIVVDNKVDLLAESRDNVVYFRGKPLLAEHGFSLLINLDDCEEGILLDAGGSKETLSLNMESMGIDLNNISKIVLSHGHADHYKGLSNLLERMKLSPKIEEWDKDTICKEIIEKKLKESRIPVIIHPAAIKERWMIKENGLMTGPFPAPPVKEWESLGAEMVYSSEPKKIYDGCITTGYIPRKSFEKSGIPSNLLYRDGDEFLPYYLEDDQAIVINLEGKGLLIISGCAHSGIINTIEYGKELTGVDKVYGVIGGFHLACSGDDDINRTVDYIKKEGIKYIIPTHCTGFKTVSRIFQEMPTEFIEGIVGGTYTF